MPDARVSVLFFSNETTRGGTEEHILQLLRRLDRNLFRLTLACTPELAHLLAGDVPEDVEVAEIRLYKLSHVTGALQLWRLMRRNRVDILHSHLSYASFFASPLGTLCRIPVILETTHVRESWRTGRLKSKYFVDRAIGRCIDHFIAVSEANADYLKHDKGLPARKIRTIHNGVDIRRFDKEPFAYPVREQLRFGQNDPILLVAARLTPQKGHRHLLAAMPRVLEQFPTARLVCVGDGELRGELEVLAAYLGITDSVRFVGYQREIPRWLGAADFTVLPSLYEGLPLVAMESLAASKAIVATEVDGTPEIVVDGETGLLVPSGDAPALAQAICRMLREPEFRQQCAKNGHERVLGSFTAEAQVQHTQDLYLSALRKALGRRPLALDSIAANRLTCSSNGETR
jgi:glycosyltransferase involved in cell wall biosynthesis